MANKVEGTKIKLDRRVTVIGTGKFGMLKDVEYTDIHPLQAEALEKKGAVKLKKTTTKE